MSNKRIAKMVTYLGYNLNAYKSPKHSTHTCYYCKQQFKLYYGEMLYIENEQDITRVFCSYTCRSNYRKKTKGGQSQ